MLHAFWATREHRQELIFAERLKIVRLAQHRATTLLATDIASESVTVAINLWKLHHDLGKRMAAGKQPNNIGDRVRQFQELYLKVRESRFLHVDVVGLLLSSSEANAIADDSEALKAAAWQGHATVVELLLDDRQADPTANDSEALKSAAWMGNVKVVELLLSDGRADPSAKGSEALCKAKLYGHDDAVELLLADGRVDPSTSV
jgi:hypothetical protein